MFIEHCMTGWHVVLVVIHVLFASRALVFICHGVGEHCQRYDLVADPLTNKGFLVFSHDHGESLSRSVLTCIRYVYFVFLVLKFGFLIWGRYVRILHSFWSSTSSYFTPASHMSSFTTSNYVLFSLPRFFSLATASPSHFCPHGPHPDVSHDVPSQP